jgi:hypothetical protein
MVPQEIKKADLKAPRYRPQRTSLLTEKFYRTFRKKFPEYKDVPNRDLTRIINSFNEKLWETAISNRDGIELPEGLGVIFIGTCNPPSKRYNTNYSLSVDVDQRVMHRNFESDNYMAKIFYTNYANKYRYQNREVYQFKGCREFTKATSDAYLENWKLYIQVDNYAKINKLFDKQRYKEILRKQQDQLLTEYNEFDLN